MGMPTLPRIPPFSMFQLARSSPFQRDERRRLQVPIGTCSVPKVISMFCASSSGEAHPVSTLTIHNAPGSTCWVQVSHPSYLHQHLMHCQYSVLLLLLLHSLEPASHCRHCQGVDLPWHIMHRQCNLWTPAYALCFYLQNLATADYKTSPSRNVWHSQNL